MDVEQDDMQFLGLFGIYRQASKILVTRRKIFTQITLSFILPLSFIFLAQIQISHLLRRDVVRDEIALDGTSTTSPNYHTLSDLVASDLTKLFLVKAAYLTFFVTFSLLSIAAVVYAVACVYTARDDDLALGTIISVVPKVWKRLMATFICVFAATFVYSLAAAILFVFWVVFFGPTKIGWVVLGVFIVISIGGFVYMSVVFQLASIVSVLEDACGIKAMAKSWTLIRGNTVVAVAIFLKLNFASSAIVQVALQRLVVHGGERIGSRVGYAVLCLVCLSLLFLFGHVVQTVLYFVCKSYHHESIDKSALSDRLEIYRGEYVPLKGSNVQLEQFYV